jgi:hypothetical protein
MPNNPNTVKLIRRFEPILFFHPQERFFPSDAKRYLERCALWKAEAPFNTKDSWGGKGSPFPRAPMIAHGNIAAIQTETQPGETFLGEPQGASFPFLITNNVEERFLEMNGWQDALTVTDASENRFAALDSLAASYVNDPALSQSRFWYHAEVFDKNSLRQIAAQPRSDGLNLSLLFAQLQNPTLICYYLFYPGHDEDIEGCGPPGPGTEFGGFAGEWTCAAVLLEHPNNNVPQQPTHIGLTSRNVGRIQAQDQEQRVGMIVGPWSSVNPVTDNPRLFVARGTHGLYLQPGQQELSAFTPGDVDPSRGSCGEVEDLDDVTYPPPEESTSPSTLVAIGKGIVVALTLGAATPWLTGEYKFGSDSPPPTQPQHDFPPDSGQFGTIVLPQALKPTDLPEAAQAQSVINWAATETPIQGRAYNFLVDRAHQIWWPGTGNNPGYAGRWGPRVDHDPHGRRAGMRFPEFSEMFLVALAKT